MYGRIVDGVFEYAPRKIHLGRKTIYNPKPEHLLAAGYLPLVFTEAPEVDEHHVAVCKWEQVEDKIVQSWEIQDA